MSLSGKSLHIPDGIPASDAFPRTTHLAIGAHQDDLEIFAYHGIATCYQQADKWFGGVTVTNGAGSSRIGPYRDFTDEEMVRIRAKEQDKAADIGEYAFQLQLGLSSAEVRDPALADSIINELLDILMRSRPEVLYLHNPADKHDSHIAVLTLCLEAVRRMPAETRPEQVYGCEVWRDLDWVDDDRKVVLRTDLYPDLAKRLIDVFDSQISGGKNYTDSTLGRRMANATYYKPRQSDGMSACTLALDLAPLVQDEHLSLCDFTVSYIQQFKEDVAARINRFSPLVP